VENMQFLKLRPNRVAHGQFLHPETGGTIELWEELKLSRIPMGNMCNFNVVISNGRRILIHIWFMYI